MPQAPKDVRIVCGLGNPGSEYALTRHNAGFAVVDALAERFGVRYWKSEGGCDVAVVKTHYGLETHEVILAKPQSYMNTSGGPLSKLARAHKVSPAEILVVHDEVDLPQGRIQVKFGGGLNAHNGLRSIADKLGTRDFSRVRCGIGRPPGKMSVADYALRKLKGNFAEEFLVMAQEAADTVERCLEQGVSSQL
ncbi:MAG: aminoacyl-tRNA hydrolase [Atopobiaceae bacterium]|jgi:PTH1 family peptidyl-tRNA hydrolase|nr:aminoacyl-tRNA hydrolase [Atopobiaceae bacterium]